MVLNFEVDDIAYLERLCDIRCKIGAKPYDAKSPESRNAVIKLHEIDEKIARKVLEVYKKCRVR